MTGTATQIEADLETFTGDARLYRLDPPMLASEYDYDTETEVETAHEYVIVSAVVAMFSGPETYIFAADSRGEIQSWSELDGSFRGALNHAGALAGAGYEVAVEVSR